MSPNEELDESGHVRYQLTPDDYALIERVHLTNYTGPEDYDTGDKSDDELMHEMCVMQLVSCLVRPPERRIKASDVRAYRYNPDVDADDRPIYDDHPICVSEQITYAMVALNDQYTEGESRQRLKELVPLVMNTCPVVRRPLFRDEFYERRHLTDDYFKLERRRKKIINEVKDRGGSLDEMIEAVKQAATVTLDDTVS